MRTLPPCHDVLALFLPPIAGLHHTRVTSRPINFTCCLSTSPPITQLTTHAAESTSPTLASLFSLLSFCSPFFFRPLFLALFAPLPPLAVSAAFVVVVIGAWPNTSSLVGAALRRNATKYASLDSCNGTHSARERVRGGQSQRLDKYTLRCNICRRARKEG